jgi:histidinol-phosphate aminotransferase
MSITEPQVQPHIQEVAPYRPGMAIEALARTYAIDPARIVKLASNENPYGMSPSAQAAAQAATAEAHRYPDNFALRQALAHCWGVDTDMVVLGNGSNDILDLIARVYLGTGVQSVSSQYAFGVYQLVTKITGGTNVVVPARDFGHDLQAMRDAITSQTAVVWIANPNNPTGTLLSPAELKSFLETVPSHVIVVLDEAYNEYLQPEDHGDAVAWLRAHPNLIITRTFSKAYGLAGFRVGYAMASPAIACMLNRVRQPFNVSHVALAAALAALQDQAFIRASYEHNRRGIKQLEAGLKSLGLVHLPTYGNFVTIRLRGAGRVNEALLKQGIIVRPIAEYGLPDYLRVSVGLPEQNEQFLETLAKILRY